MNRKAMKNMDESNRRQAEMEQITREIETKLSYNRNRAERLTKLASRKSALKLSTEKRKRLDRRRLTAESNASQLQGVLDQFTVQSKEK